MEKNKRFWLIKSIFNKSLFDASYEIFKQFVVTPDMNYDRYRSEGFEDEQLRVQKFFIAFCLTVCQRAQSRT